MGENTIRVIERVAFSGKWVEFWFADGAHDLAHFDQCCKVYMLDELIEKSGMGPEIVNTGFKGKALDWPTGNDRPSRLVPAIEIIAPYLADLSKS